MRESGLRRVIVSGGAGFIGSALVRHLIATGAEVVVIDKLTYASTRAALSSVESSGRVRLIVEDICNASAMNEIFMQVRPRHVFHLAAETHVDRSITDPAVFISTNIAGTFNLLESARAFWAGLQAGDRELFRFVHVSTDEVFGSLGETGAFNELTPYDPSSPYSASKAASDHLAKAWHRTYGLPVLVSNCSNNYGPYQFPEKLIPVVISKALEGKQIPIYGAGQNVRDWLYVDDHARALVRIAEAGRPGETYVVGGQNERNNLQVAESICDILDRLAPSGTSRRKLISFVEDRPGHDFRYAIDPAKLTSELGWQPLESFESALEKTVRWYLENRDWWTAARSAEKGARPQ